VADLDLSTLEHTPHSFVNDDLREREDDAIWCVRFQESWIYVYILIEFQSTVDRLMAVRLMNYISRAVKANHVGGMRTLAGKNLSKVSQFFRRG